MARSLVCAPLAACMLFSALCVSAAEAQDWLADVAFDQSFSSSDPLRSPGGIVANAGALAVWGPFGLHATFRSLWDGGDDLFQDCVDAGASCVPGALGVSYRVRSAGLGISYDFVNPTDVFLTLGLIATRNWRSERVEHQATGARAENELPVSWGLSASAHLRLRPLLGSMRPEFSMHYDYSGRGECAADAACWPGQRAFGLSIGLGWVFRSDRED